jgi:hypothetical protein
VSEIDLNNPPTGHKWKVSLDGAETIAERNVRLGKEIAIFGFALGLAVTFVVLAVNIVVDPNASADDKKWAFAAFTSIGSGVLGYLLKR